MNKAGLVIGGVAVAIIGVVLYVMIGGSGGDSHASAPVEAPSNKVALDRGGPTAHISPALPPGSNTPAMATVTDSDVTHEYTASGTHVRDHRPANPNRPADVAPNIHPENSRKLPPELTQGIAQQVRAVMLQCTHDLPKEARGTGPRLEGQIVVGVKAGKLTVTSDSMQLTQVTGAAADATRQCIEQKSVGLGIDAADQPDLDAYTINLSFAIP